MPRNISFALTTPQFLDGSKDVTRRLGWHFLKSGDVLCAVEKGMGLKKGEKIKRLGMIEVVSVRTEHLDEITQDDVRREGFPDWTPRDFTDFFCRESGCKYNELVRRIEFRRLPEGGFESE